VFAGLPNVVLPNGCIASPIEILCGNIRFSKVQKLVSNAKEEDLRKNFS
jgi:hypothetical protein